MNRFFGLFFLCGLGLVDITQTAFAATTIDAAQMLVNLSQSITQFEKLATGAAYVLGVGFLFRGIYQLKLYGQALTMSSAQTSLKTPLIYLALGAGFLAFPSMVDVVMSSTFGDDNILAYSDWTGPSSFQGVTMSAIFRIVQFVGLISFLRGWLLLSKSAQHGGGGQNTLSRGATHIIGGVFAMNIVGTSNVLSATLGVSFF